MRSLGKNPIKEVNKMSTAITENKFSFEETFELVKGQNIEQTMRSFGGRIEIYTGGGCGV